MDSKLSAKLVSLFLIGSVCLLAYTAMSTWGVITPTPGKLVISRDVEIRQDSTISYFLTEDLYLDRLEVTGSYVEFDDLFRIGTTVSDSSHVNITLQSWNPLLTTGTVAKWSAECENETSVTFTVYSPVFLVGRTYHVYVDTVITANIQVGSSREISLSWGTWSLHQFEIFLPVEHQIPVEEPDTGDNNPATSTPGNPSWTWTSPALIVIVSASVLLALVLLLRRPKGRSGTRHT